MNTPDPGPGQSLAIPSRQWLGLAAAIASIAIVGIMLSGIAPLLSLNLERLEVGAVWNGLMGAIPSVAMVSISAFIPSIIRRLGAAPSIYIGSGIAFATLLLFPIITFVPAWFLLRFLMGLGIGVALVVSETWINALAPPDKRGLVMGIYVSVLCAGLATGPILVSLTGSEGALPFIVIASVLFVATLPIPVASRSGAPALRDHAAMPLGAAFRQAPVVMVVGLLNGAIWLAILALLSVYGVRSGLSEDRALFLLTIYVIGNVGFQIPIGRLLDRWSAALILGSCGCAQILGALAMPLALDGGVLAWLILLIWGGSLGGVYTTALTMLGRTFKTEELSGGNAAFAMAFEIGAISGPLLAGLGMRLWDPNGMLVVIGLSGAGIIWAGLRAGGARRPL